MVLQGLRFLGMSKGNMPVAEASAVETSVAKRGSRE